MSEQAGDGFVAYLATDPHPQACQCAFCKADRIPRIIAKAPELGMGYGTQSESQRRKAQPLFQGFLMYFPDACLAVAEHSRKANEKHNPGERLHWSKDKSKDHADCIARHLIDIGPEWDRIDLEFGSLHATALAWRALALLQTVLEREAKK